MINHKAIPSIVFLSTYPPRECGIATFTQDLLNSCQIYLGKNVVCKVAALNFTSLDTYKYPKEVVWEIDQNSKKDHLNLANIVNKDTGISGVILQHEYGIFGGKEGVNILSFMENCKKPMLVTLHTILPEPTVHMNEVTTRIIDLATTIVVLTSTSKLLVEKIYPKSVGKVFVIPHGIHHIDFADSHESKVKLELNRHIILTTFGLLSRGKGIEYGIRALPKIIKKHPSVLYLILGETHPVILRNEGEKYRNKLLSLIKKLKLEKHVRFYDQYLSLPELFEFLKATDIYISTSINPNQAVSGTLSYALGTGRSVISTQFAQAKEIVTKDIGRLVPIKNSKMITTAVLDLLSDEKRLKQMNSNAYKSTRPMLWSNVAQEYISLLERLIIPEININHLKSMTDDFGLFQFAKYLKPNLDFGYTLDDNGRAAIVCSWLMKIKTIPELEKLLIIYLDFIKKCQKEDGSFINYLDYKEKSATSQNNIEDLEDCEMRTMWSLGEIISNRILSEEIRKKAENIFVLKFNNMKELKHLRSRAYAIKSFALLINTLPNYKEKFIKAIELYSNSLVESLKKHTKKSWYWFESHLSYNNGLLPESLLIAGTTTLNQAYTDEGLATLEFLIEKTFSNNVYYPIGQSDWYKNNKKRSEFDQQPEDPASMILLLSRAYKVTKNTEYIDLSDICFGWFLGKNSLNISLYDKISGGCYDGLHPNRANLNEGAESLVSYLMSNLTMRDLN